MMARIVKSKSDVNQNVVSLKVTLRDTKPSVWRRLLVPGETTLGDLHRAIQATMGWEDYHLHTFDIEGRRYDDLRVVYDVADEKRVTLNGLIKSGVTRFAYTYDFGDNWEHALLIEKSLPVVEALPRPTCIAGCGRPRGGEHLEEVERKIADLEALRRELQDLIGQCRHGTVAECRIVQALSPSVTRTGDKISTKRLPETDNVDAKAGQHC